MNFKKTSAIIASVLMPMAILQGCLPVPHRTLSKEEKVADMYWIYSQFGENYAPLELKEKLHGFSYDQLKTDYLYKAITTQTNEEFYAVMFEFVAKFKDAHTSAALNSPSLPGRASVAYLGFNGTRDGDELIVTSLLPTYASTSSYPIKVGDRITKVDGKTLKNIVDTEMTKNRDLGNTESNYTALFPKIFNRTSISNGIPAATDAVITIARGLGTSAEEIEIKLPWIKKDVIDFAKEQSEASKSKKADRESVTLQAGTAVLNQATFAGMELPAIFKQLDPRIAGYDFRNNFRFIDDIADLDSASLRELLGSAVKGLKIEGFSTDKLSAESPLEELKAKRTVPANAMFLPSAETYPTYITSEPLKDSKGRSLGTVLVGYMYLDTFSPDTDADQVVTQVQNTVKALQKNGVERLVIDMINNGGGSLTLGAKLAQIFSKKKILAPEIQMRLSESWLDEFEQESQVGKSDTEKELARRTFAIFNEDKKDGKRLSRNLSLEAIMPFELKGNKELLDRPLEITLLTNEMCASMCDIFTGIMKDNKLAVVVGAKTMGAGGNVVNHDESPNAHLQLRQTESLLVRADGSYIENNGINPDIAVEVNKTAKEKYEPVRRLAIEKMTTLRAVDEKPLIPVEPFRLPRKERRNPWKIQ